jgi:hypothetical protein
LVDLNAKPATTTTATAKPATKPNNMTLELGAGALALLLLGGGAYAISRRRRAREEEMWDDEPMVEHESAEPMVEQTPAEAATMPEIRENRIEEPAMAATAGASAFAWGNGDRMDEQRETQVESASETSDESDRRPGESWVERAYRGPSPANPSVSLKARLKRAAFFDKREREVAAGTAEPVDTDEGLPEAMVEEQQQERELA